MTIDRDDSRATARESIDGDQPQRKPLNNHWRFVDLAGRTFDHWTVLYYLGREKRMTLWLCQCECGNKGRVSSVSLKDRQSRSCGCRIYTEQGPRPGEGRSRLYGIWKGIIRRCLNPKTTLYHAYGGRGIGVCREWRENFQAFKKWATENGYADLLTIERKDVNGHYEPSNCCWIPKAEQTLNTRRSVRVTAFGETKTLVEWERDSRSRIQGASIKIRIDKGWPPEEAIVTPPKPGVPREPKVRKMRRMTPAQEKAIRNIASGLPSGHDLCGRSTHGSHGMVMKALIAKGFVDRDDRLTGAGIQFLETIGAVEARKAVRP